MWLWLAEMIMVYEKEKTAKFPLIKDSFVASERKFSWTFSFFHGEVFLEELDSGSAWDAWSVTWRIFSSHVYSFFRSRIAKVRQAEASEQRRSAEKSGACEVNSRPRTKLVERLFMMMIVIGEWEKNHRKGLRWGVAKASASWFLLLSSCLGRVCAS